MLAIPRFVSIKGVGNKKPCFILTNDRMWFLKGSNTIDYIDVDVTQINRTYTHEVISIDNNARDVTIKNSKFRITSYNVCYTKLLRVVLNDAKGLFEYVSDDAAVGIQDVSDIGEREPMSVTNYFESYNFV